MHSKLICKSTPGFEHGPLSRLQMFEPLTTQRIAKQKQKDKSCYSNPTYITIQIVPFT
jgi:hypothetical protein